MTSARMDVFRRGLGGRDLLSIKFRELESFLGAVMLFLHFKE